jgi:hypothetical protein
MHKLQQDQLRKLQQESQDTTLDNFVVANPSGLAPAQQKR